MYFPCHGNATENIYNVQGLKHHMIKDSNPHFRINPALDPNVCRIAPKMLWIHYLVGIIIYFAECQKIGR